MKKILLLILFTLLFEATFAQKTQNLSDTAFVEVIQIDNSILLDIRYATPNNFMKKAIYPCGKCLLRKKVAYALSAAQADFKAKGYRIKIYDGYRPHSAQWKLWENTPDKNYVADPKKGSMHNRGAAVDLTLVDQNGKELDMGTPYDFFGKEAHINYTKHSKEVLANRKLLAQILKKHGFGTTKTEWWHFSYRKQSYTISNKPLPCN